MKKLTTSQVPVNPHQNFSLAIKAILQRYHNTLIL